VQVRAAVVGDSEAIAGIHVRSWRATYAGILSPESLGSVDAASRAALWSRRLSASDDGRTVLVGCDDGDDSDGEVVGFLYLGPTPDEDDDPAAVAQVLAVHVDPRSTGRGTGGALLQHAVSQFDAVGYREATLWVVGDNDGARRFYERAGWSPDGASRREPLAVEGEAGEEVTVLRYRLGR